MADERPDHDGLLRFLGNAVRHDVLSREDEAALLRRLKRGDKKARTAIIAANVRFLLKFARQHAARNGMEFEDAFQEGAIGELRALEKFDVGRGYRLSTYATWWVRQGIQRAGQETARTVRLPTTALARLRNFRLAFDAAAAAGREPTDAALAEILGVSEQEIAEARRLSMLSATASLDEPVTEDGATLADFCGDPSTGTESVFEHLERQERAVALRQAVARLSKLEQEVLRHRMETDLTLEETAVRVAPFCTDRQVLSRERIRQIQKEATAKLRTMMS